MTIRNIARTKKLILFCFLLVIMPLNLHAEEPAFHTIQTGSFVDIKSAQKQFDSIVKGLNEQELSFFRIEKIGKYYSLRLGKFKDHATANTFLQKNKPLLQGAIILKAITSEDRIFQRYTKDSIPRDMTASGKPVSGIMPEGLKDVQSLQHPLPVTESKGSVPVKESSGEAVADNALKNVQSLQRPSPAGDTGIFSNVKGRFYVSDYYSNDSDEFEFHVLTSRLNVYKHEDKESRYYYTLDARVRKKIFNGEMEENVPEWKVDEAWVGIKFPEQKMDVIGGRQNIYELYNTRVDGLNVKYSFDNGLGFGVFGGLAPDKEDESLNTDYESIGGYLFFNQEKHKVQFGYENLNYKGDTDREYFSLRIYSKFHEKMRLNAVSSASINQLTDDFEVENANINLLYAHSKKVRFNIFYNYFRTIKFYESTREYLELSDVSESFFLDDNSRTRIGMRVDYKLMKGLKVYSSAEYERRKEDEEDKLRLTGGLRKYDLYGFDLSGRYTYIDDFEASSDEFNAEITRHFFNKLDVSLYASREEKKLDAENAYTTRALTYGASIYWMISKRYFMLMFIESYERDSDLDEEGDKQVTTSVFTQAGYKF
ncbi:MAG: hypothetical protein AMK71_04900 [Nitrospira bacterium SG8_35_4]|nr:MAG: hypothetical protein AMK71_04900 [Nitrospira bacterium SG8_35_4]